MRLAKRRQMLPALQLSFNLKGCSSEVVLLKLFLSSCSYQAVLKKMFLKTVLKKRSLKIVATN
jgi:hypothetical protein